MVFCSFDDPEGSPLGHRTARRPKFPFGVGLIFQKVSHLSDRAVRLVSLPFSLDREQ